MQVTLSEDQLNVLHSLLGLVHFDRLAAEWYTLLPDEIRTWWLDSRAEDALED